MRRVVLDTDIGTDVDDALALALLLGSDDVELVGVTTVYGDTLLRARLTRRLMGLSRRGEAVPVIPGRSQTRSGRPVWWPGHEGSVHEDLDREVVQDDVDAVDWLVRTVLAEPGEIDLLAVGPLTNVAAALDAEPDFAGALRTLTIMGGDFSATGRVAEHNFRCDAVAAERVLSSGAPVVATGLDATTVVRIEPGDVERIAETGPFGAALAAEVGVFWEFHGEEWNNPHDPVAALTMLEPELFRIRDAQVRILAAEDQVAGMDEPEGYALEGDAPTGRISVASVVDRDAVGRSIVERICAAQG